MGENLRRYLKWRQHQYGDFNRKITVTCPRCQRSLRVSPEEAPIIVTHGCFCS